MMKHESVLDRLMWAMTVSAIACSIACSALTGEPRHVAAVEPAPASSAAPAEASHYECTAQPLRLEVHAPRNLDTRDGPPMSSARYKKMRWAAGHGKPPSPAFAWSSAQAVDAVVELEAKQPGLIPAPYREALLAAPRDPTLRLQIGACELNDPATRRRAAYDGAMALLLGGSGAEASRLIALGTRGASDPTITSCGRGAGDCAAGSRCDVAREVCVTPEELAYARISRVEVDVETALTRGLLSELKSPARLTTSARGGWLHYMVHSCGQLLCKLTDYESNERISLVVWDLRDRGTVEVDSSPAANDHGHGVDFACLDRCQEAFNACAATEDVCNTREVACRESCQGR